MSTAPDPMRQRLTHERIGAAAPVYLAVVAAVDRRIRALRWTMQECDDRSGLQDGYTAKLLKPDSPRGKQANWQTLQLLVDALWPGGVSITISAQNVPLLPQGSMKNRPTPARAAMYVPTPEKAREMNECRNRILSEDRRTSIARKAARTRWRKQRELTAEIERRAAKISRDLNRPPAGRA